MGSRIAATREDVERYVRGLEGLKLSSTSSAGNMRTFQIGELRLQPGGHGPVGEYALHVQCPWRIEAQNRIITGWLDWCDHAAQEELPPESWDPAMGGSLQEERLRDLLEDHDYSRRYIVNNTGELLVAGVLVDQLGGCELHLSGGCRLIVFPAGCRGEDWRLFRPGSDAAHLVLEAGLAHLD